MPLAQGTRIGPYEVVSVLGTGGMGEVYRATDTRLKRQVAVKILPESLAGDASRLARLQREAEALAAMSHPNVAVIHGIEEFNGFKALVMELVEGEDLTDRIARGPLSLDEALPIALQIAEAMEAAHERGIIHRDLKPANIKVRSDGTVKVLDFGVAKMVGRGGDAPSLDSSPTVTARASEAGMIIGTAAYMAPEQARGRAVDRRADIWAFGVIVCELLTGERMFKGSDPSEILASVLRDSTSPALPPETPQSLRRLLERCLDRDVRQRLRDIGEARIEMARIQSGKRDVEAGFPPAAPARWLGVRVFSWGVVWILCAVLAGYLWSTRRVRATTPAAPRKLLSSIGAEASLAPAGGAILSPDGTTLAFVAESSGGNRLFIRKLDQLHASPLAGTEGAANPFFSPDGQWIAFFGNRKLRKISVDGGAAIDLCDVPTGRGGTWTDDGSIIFSPSNVAGTSLMRVSAAGGIPAPFGALSAGATTQRWPQALPNGKGVIYTEHSAIADFDNANVVVAPPTGGRPKLLVRRAYFGRYAPSGHLLYMQQTTLYAVPLDLDRLETIGRAVPVVEDISTNVAIAGSALVTFSSEGTLVYVPSQATSTALPIEWLARDGKTTTLRATKADWASPRFSPDGQKVAFEVFDGKQRDIWIYQWATDTMTQVTFDAAQDRLPAWSPDSERIVFASDRAKAGIANLYSVNADGSGDVTRLTDSPDNETYPSWHPSGRYLAFTANRGVTQEDLMILPMPGTAAGRKPGEPSVFLSTPESEMAPTFSPDGRWVAYFALEDRTTYDVYVRPFPASAGRWRISTQGGVLPIWSTKTRDLLFLNLVERTVMVAPYTVVGESFRASNPRAWAPASVVRPAGYNSAYDIHPDGKHVAIALAPENQPAIQDKVVFVFDFFEHLRRVAPAIK